MNLLKVYVRNLQKHRTFSIVTIGSFSVSLAIIVILGAFLVSEYSYDSHISEIDNIYRVVDSDNTAGIPEEARELLLQQIPEVESATNYFISNEPVVYDANNFTARVIHSDEDVFSILPIEFIKGRPENIFAINTNVVITESLAQKIFGKDNPLGKALNISHNQDVVIAGIIKDFPERSTLHGDVICSSELKIRYSSSCYDDDCTYFYKLLLKLNPSIYKNDVAQKISAIIPTPINKEEKDYSLLPYKNAYFDTTITNDDLEHANIKLIELLGWLTVVLILLAVFNYVNLSISQSLSRFKEYGMKKILGLGKVRLVIQFVAEAFITIIFSFCISLVLSVVFKPVFEEMFGKAIHVEYLFSTPWLIAICIISLAVIAVITAVYPAQIALHVQARDLVNKQISGKSTGFGLRKSLIVIQFATSIAILVSLFVITRQVNHVKNKDLGFSTEQLVRIPVHWQAKDKMDVLIDRLNTIPNVVSACHSHGTPGSIWNYSVHGEFGHVSMITADSRFVETFNISVLQGRNFNPKESKAVCLINERAMKQAGWDSFEGKNFFWFEVVGLIDEFHFQNMYHEIGALMIVYGQDISHITVRMTPQDIPSTLTQLKKDFEEILPGYEFSYQFYDEFFGAMYKQEEKRASSIKIVALIALFISCIGLFGLVDFSTKKRIKEIGIRKVNGAKIWEVMVMLNKDFVKWVAIAFVIATPIAWYAMNRWLQNFAYRTELSWWIFALAGMVALAIALLTVSWQSWRAARRNPVEALRYE